MGLLIGREDAGEVHHLPEAHAGIPLHGLGYVPGAHVGAGILKAGNRGHTGGCSQHGFQRGAGGVLHHALDAFKSQHVADLVGIHVDTHSSVGDDRFGVFAYAHHGRFHVDMAVQKTGSKVLPAGIDYLCALADTVSGVAHQGDTPSGYGDRYIRQNLLRADIDQIGMDNDQVGRPGASCNCR